MAEFDAIPEQALLWVRAGHGAALATVVETWGSAPRRAGAQLAVNSAAEIQGSVSGGCVEGAVIAEALEAIVDGKCRLLDYGVADEDAFAVGLACGGRIRILVEPIGIGQGIDTDFLGELVAKRSAREAVAVRVDLATWDRTMITSENVDPDLGNRFTNDQSGLIGDRLLVIHNPPLRLVVVGAVHIAQALLPMARLAGYDCILVDPREAFATQARFPGANILHDWPDVALAGVKLDARTAVVTLTHDAKLDDPAIRTALESEVFYVGSLGSKKTHAKRLERLADGFSPKKLARIHAPVGADIAAQTPAEIAVSILAQITECLRRPLTQR